MLPSGSSAQASGSAASEGPRISRKAIWGAVWSPFFFIAVPMFFVAFAVRTTEEATGSSNIVFSALMWALAAIGLTAPIGTTALGLMAISEIRHSAGKTIGLPLALADALFYPIVLLDALIIGGCAMFATLAVKLLAQFSGNANVASGSPNLILLGALGLIIVVPLDYWIVRLAWRAANKPIASSPTESATRT
jgi:hypothetical protein